MALDGSRWIARRPKYFWPVRILSRVFCGKLLAYLAQVYSQKELNFLGRMKTVADPVRFSAWPEQLRKKEWVVYAKPPFDGPEHDRRR